MIALQDALLTTRAPRGAREITPLQRKIRALDRIWGIELVDAMLRAAQAMAVGDMAVAEARIEEMRGHPRGAVKRVGAVRRGADELLRVAREAIK